MIIIPKENMRALEEIRDYLYAQAMQDVRIEVTAKGIWVQIRDEVREKGARRFKK